MNELCTTYFKWNNKIVDGFKVVKLNGSYVIKAYTTCKKLGNWQDFLRYNSLDKVIDYFTRLVKRDEEDRKSFASDSERDIRWTDIEDKWRYDTLQALLNVRL